MTSVDHRLEGEAWSWPRQLAALHRRTDTGDRYRITVRADTNQQRSECRPTLADLLIGGGFRLLSPPEPSPSEPSSAGPVATEVVSVDVERRWTLPDTVAAQMRLLVCGLNPSPASADRGVGFGRPGNRFWPAAIAAGLVAEAFDPDAALAQYGIGMTDLVKRTTTRASELSVEEYQMGLARVERLVEWLRPDRICFVGLAGWRATLDRSAKAGWQTKRIGGRPVYLMPSTSGLNAHSQLPDLTEHLSAAATSAAPQP